MASTFLRVYRETAGGPIFVDTTGGVVKVRYLNEHSMRQLRAKVDAQSNWSVLQGNDQPWSLTLDGREKPDWQYQGGNQDDADPDTYDDGQPEGKSEPGEAGDAQGVTVEKGEGQAEAEGQGEGEGGDGQPEDEPVMWSDFGLHQDRLVKYLTASAAQLAKVSQETVEYQEVVGTALKAMRAEIKAVKNSKGGDGNGGAIVRVEIHTPKEIKLGDGLFHKQFPLLAKFIGAGMHVYLPGPPGGGKSHAAEQIAKLLARRFASLSLGPTTPDSRLWGGMDANGRFHEPPMVAGCRYAMEHPDEGFVFCLDEMDNGHPGIIATLNSALANGWFTAPNGDTITLGRNVTFIGAANTFGTGPTAEFSGRNRLDAATLDRFLYLPWDNDEKMEATLVRAHLADADNGSAIAAEWLDVWLTCRKNVAANNLRVFVTMRGAIHGAKLLAAGLDVETVLESVLLHKLPTDQAAKVNPL